MSKDTNKIDDMSNQFDSDIIKDIKEDINGYSFDNIIDDLPKILKEPCQYLVEETEKEVFLLGALGVISGVLPNIHGHYDGKWIGPNLYVFIIGPYGVGKGGLEYSRCFGQAIHDHKKTESETQLTAYKVDILNFEVAKKKYSNKKSESKELPSEPNKPFRQMIFLPANNSKSGIIQLLKENNGKGIIFESEGDTLSDALKQDYANFSDILRKSFHHEQISMFRRMNDELIEIDHPELSVVLSSTPDQLKTLIPSPENGLISRFLYYIIEPQNNFIDVFDNVKSQYQKYFSDLGDNYKVVYDRLHRRDPKIKFQLSNRQKEGFLKTFSLMKKNLMDVLEPSLAGTVNRLGVIAFRIMMILTILRTFEETKNPSNIITCPDIDFRNANRIINFLQGHAISVYKILNNKTDKKKLAIELSRYGTPVRTISKVIFGNEMNRGTISKWVSESKK